MKVIIPCLFLSILLCGAVASRSSADQYNQGASTIRVTVSQPSTPVTDVLTAIARQSGALVEADSSVQDTMNACQIDGNGVEQALNALTKQVPGLTWTKVYVAANANPNPDDLSAAIKALHKLGLSDLSIAEPTGATVVRKDNTQTPALDRRVIYVVTNDQAWSRVQAEKDYQSAQASGQAPAPTTDDLVNSTQAALHAIAQTFPQMTADQQAQIMPMVWQQLREITKDVSPEVMSRFEHTTPTPQ